MLRLFMLWEACCSTAIETGEDPKELFQKVLITEFEERAVSKEGK